TILTTPAGRRQIESHPIYASMQYYAEIHFFMLPEEVTELAVPAGDDSLLVELLDHLSIAFCQEFGSHACCLPVDGVDARDSLVTLVGYIESGHHAVGGATLVANREQFLPELDASFGGEPVLSASPRQLVELALQCLHEESSGKLVIPENRNFVRPMRELI